MWKGRGGAPEANKLVYTKRQNHIYAISTHETTFSFATTQKYTFQLGKGDCTASHVVGLNSYAVDVGWLLGVFCERSAI